MSNYFNFIVGSQFSYFKFSAWNKTESSALSFNFHSDFKVESNFEMLKSHMGGKFYFWTALPLYI